jgi:hypothetical protein
MANKAAAFERARTILVGLPGVEEGPCYGTPGFRVKRKRLTKVRAKDLREVIEVAWRLAAPKSLVAGTARQPSSERATRASNT